MPHRFSLETESLKEENLNLIRCLKEILERDHERSVEILEDMDGYKRENDKMRQRWSEKHGI